jgi:alkyl hydroperoxide reductase subunit F
MLDTNIKTQLKTYFEKIVSPIVLTVTLDESPASAQMLELLNEVAEQSEKITVSTNGQAKNVPSFTVSKVGEDARITFSGLPMGHEMTSFILAILQASGYPPKVEEDILARIRKLEGKFRFQTFISLSCHNCPDVVQALNLMAALNPGVEHEMIDGALFQSLVDQYQIMAVPTVILNGEVFGQGRMGAEEIIAKLDTGSAQRVRLPPFMQLAKAFALELLLSALVDK